MERDHIRAVLAGILSDVTGRDDAVLADEQNLRDEFQIDSLDLISMAIEVHDKLGVEIEPKDAGSLLTIGDVVTLVADKLASRPAPKRAA